MRRALWALWTVWSLWAIPPAAQAWDREHARTWAVLPEGSGGPEGLEVAPDGTVYVSSFGFDASGPLAGPGRIFVFDSNGRFQRELTVAGSSPNLLGLKWHAGLHKLLVADFGHAAVLAVDVSTGSADTFMTLPLPTGAASSPNDITFDSAGNVYVSDSFQGTIWRTGPSGGAATAWVTDALLTTDGVPPFGANGLRFNQAETALFVANTGNDTVVKIPIQGTAPTGTPGAPAVFVSGINGADGLLVDEDDRVWVAANQEDEIVVVSPTGRVVAKLGDFYGLRQGTPRGLLFPASIRFLRHELLVTNLALNLTLFGLPPAIDTPWTAEVTRYTISALPARIPKELVQHQEDRR